MKRPGRPPIKRDAVDAALREQTGKGLQETLLALATSDPYLRAQVRWTEIARVLTARTGIPVSVLNAQKWASLGAVDEALE